MRLFPARNQCPRRLPSFFVPSLLLFLSLIFQPQPAESRTIALVYDDSGSMRTRDSWIYANYATQVLSASLREDDNFVVIRMNAGMAGDTTPQSIKTWPEPTPNDPTPYASVEQAMQVILGEPSISQQTLGRSDEKNWLIIATDGEFKDVSNASTIRSFFNQVKGQVEVVFLLIGNVKKDTVNLWSSQSPDQVQVFQVSSSNTGQDLINKMTEIAALIAGRDNREPAGLHKSGSRITLNSPYPLRRISLLMQQPDSKSSLPDLTGVNLSGATNQSVQFKTEIAESRTGTFVPSPMKARIIHSSNTRILPPGDFTLEFNASIHQVPVQVLLETAVDLQVSLHDEQGVKLQPDNGVYRFCDSDQLQVGVVFVSQDNANPLELSPADLRNIQVTKLIHRQTETLKYDEGSRQFRSTLQKIGPHQKTMAVEAQSPGYFFLKSNVFNLESIACNRDGAISPANNQISLPYTFSDEPQLADTSTTLTVRFKSGPYVGPERQDRLRVEGLPRGVELHVDGSVITRDTPQIQLPTLTDGQRLQLRLARSRDFKADQPQEILLKFDSGRWITWENPPALSLVPQPRRIEVETQPALWQAQVTRMNDHPPVGLQFLVDGAPVSAEEFKYWQVKENHQGRFSTAITRDESDRTFSVKPGKYWYSPLWTEVGEHNMAITLSSPFPLENQEIEVPLHILWASWWERARNTVYFLLALWAFLWWLKRILQKNRFDRGAYIHYESREGQRKTMEDTVFLAENILVSWLIPTKTEKAVVHGISLKAGSSKDHIFITKGQLDENARVGGSSLKYLFNNDQLSEKDVRLMRNDALELSSGKRTVVYQYTR